MRVVFEAGYGGAVLVQSRGGGEDVSGGFVLHFADLCFVVLLRISFDYLAATPSALRFGNLWKDISFISLPLFLLRRTRENERI